MEYHEKILWVKITQFHSPEIPPPQEVIVKSQMFAFGLNFTTSNHDCRITELFTI